MYCNVSFEGYISINLINIPYTYKTIIPFSVFQNHSIRAFMFGNAVNVLESFNGLTLVDPIALISHKAYQGMWQHYMVLLGGHFSHGSEK